jgi:uncharacterized protein YndB with AHSA1/START domain
MASVRSSVHPVTDRVIHVSAALAVPPSAAFEHFASNALLERWLTSVANVEARVDGPYELFWRPDDRENDSTIGCRVTAVAPGRLLAFQWRSPQQFKDLANAADPLTHVVVAVASEGAGSSVHLVHSGWRSGPAWDAARVWQERAWSMAFRALERLAGG